MPGWTRGGVEVQGRRCCDTDIGWDRLVGTSRMRMAPGDDQTLLRTGGTPGEGLIQKRLIPDEPGHRESGVEAGTG